MLFVLLLDALINYLQVVLNNLSYYCEMIKIRKCPSIELS